MLFIRSSYNIIILKSSIFFYMLYDYITMTVICITDVWYIVIVCNSCDSYIWYHTITLLLSLVLILAKKLYCNITYNSYRYYKV